jgi:hypothetical protein
MILVRDVFQLKFGKAKEAKALWKEGARIAKKFGGPGQAMTDAVGPFYTLVFESTYRDLSAYEKALKKVLGAKEWSQWYQKFTSLVESGYREIYTIL